MRCHLLHSLPLHVAGRVAGRVAHCDVGLDAADADPAPHCPALHAVLPAEHADRSLTHRTPPVVLTVLTDLLGIVSARETPVIALTHSGGNGGERSTDAGQGCPCQGPAFEDWQTVMLYDPAPASERHYDSSISTTQHSTAQHSTAQHSTPRTYTAYANEDTANT